MHVKLDNFILVCITPGFMASQLRDSLLLAALTTASISITSLLAFTEVTRAYLTPSIATIACSFPLSLGVLKPGLLVSDVRRAITSCLVGWGLGSVLYFVSSLIAGHIGNKAIIATLLSFPIVLGLMLADSACKSPLEAFIQPGVAIITMYVTSSFAKDLAYMTGLYMTISYSVASIVTLIVFLSVRVVLEAGTSKSDLREHLSEYQGALTHWFEGLSGFMLSAAAHHDAELDERQKRATEALNVLQETIKEVTENDALAVFKDPESAQNFSTTAVIVHSQLLALRGTIFQDGYSEDSIRVLLSPVRKLLDSVRMTTILAMRPTTPVDVKQSAVDSICADALLLYNEFARSVSANCGTETREEIRLVFAITSVVRFATLSQHFLSSTETATLLLSPFQSFWSHMKRQLVRFVSASEWRKTTNYKFAFRAALAQQVMAQLLILLSRSYPSRVTPYMFWAMVPVVTTFLHTVGAGLTLGTRNLAGCLLGASLGVVTALSNSGNKPAIFLEMLIISFVAKFFSDSKTLNVAALTFASTWNVLSIPNVHVEQLRVLLSLIGYRISLTLLGVFVSALLSVILFPSFAAALLRKSTARSVTAAAQLVVEAIAGVIGRAPLKPTQSFDEERSVCCSSFSPSVTVSVFEGAGSKALSAIRKHTVLIPAASEEAKPELVLIDKLSDDSLASVSLASLIAAEPLTQRLCDAACVFSSIAAATRVQENCHEAVFTQPFIDSLNRLVDILEGGAARIAAAVMDPKSATRIDSRLGVYVQEVTRQLLSTRHSLESSGLLASADRGGWLLMYVFHFALVEFTAAWDDLGAHLERKRRDSEFSMKSLKSFTVEESFVTDEPSPTKRDVFPPRSPSIGWT